MRIYKIGAYTWYHFAFALATKDPRAAWRTLAESRFGGGNPKQSALRAVHIFASGTESQILRSLLYKIRTYFESNPDDTEY